MSRSSLDLVAEFSRAFNYPIADEPGVPPGNERTIEQRKRLATHVNTIAMMAKEYARETGDVCLFRMSLILEETGELADAFAACAPVAAFDALLDKRYVDDGTVLACGMHRIFDEGFERVHASNLSKLDDDGRPIYDVTGKAIKSKNYQRVQLHDLVHGSRK